MASERLKIIQAAASRNLKDYGSEKANKKGFTALPDGRVVADKELFGETAKATPAIVVPEGLDTSSLRHCAIGVKDGVIRNGFTQLSDKRIVSTKKLQELITNEAK